MQQAEKSLPEQLSGVHVHFVGIKGTGMAALVEILHGRGAVITGSDVSERFYTDEILERLGLSALPFSAANITDKIQYVIYSSAYKTDKNPDLIEAVRRKIPCLLYTEALGSYSSRAYSCGVAGVHGKTSTTGLTGTILKELDLPSQVLAGSVINSFGGTCTYTSPLVSGEKHDGTDGQGGSVQLPGGFSSVFVAETCEYQRHFMSFCPQKIILTSVESDHQDFYPTFADIQAAFVGYACKLPQGGDLIFCADDDGAAQTARIVAEKRPDIHLIPYGAKADGDFVVTFCGTDGEKNRFKIRLFGGYEFALCVPGRHEVLDAAAAVTLVCRLLVAAGKNPHDYTEKIAAGLLHFSGGRRRSEVLGEFKSAGGNDVLVLDDYGHHPTAIRTTLQGYREFYKGRKIIVDFMSHTYSRTQALLQEFAQSLGAADVIILNKIYSSARENPSDFTINGKTLFEETKKSCTKSDVVYFDEPLDALSFVRSELEKPLGKEFPDGILFVTMGAGDNWRLGRALLDSAQGQKNAAFTSRLKSGGTVLQL